MTRLSVDDARCEALFVSRLQRTDTPTPAALAEMVSAAVRQFGVRGCAARMAQEFGDHPDAAAERMRWVRRLVREVPVRPPRAPGLGEHGLTSRGPESPRPEPDRVPAAA